MEIEVSEITNKHVIVDVRTPIEYNTVHIPGSYNIPLSEIPNHLDTLREIDNLVLLCRSGRRSEEAAAMIGENSKNILGGIIKWQEENKKVTRGRNVWDLSRQVRFVAGSLITLGVILGFTLYQEFFLLSGLVGLGLMQSGFSGSCMMAYALEKLPWNKTDHDTKAVVKQLRKDHV